MASNPSSPHRFALLTALLGALALALGLAACGSSESGSTEPAPDYEQALKGAPPQLAALYSQGDAVNESGVAGYRAQLAELEGYPVVVNMWASWCGPCREEFPYFQQEAAARGTEVAFMGVDTDDNTDAANTFLRDNPLPYPSFSDPDKELFAEFEGLGVPRTIFYDERGEIVHVRSGPYSSRDELATDIDKYAAPAR